MAGEEYLLQFFRVDQITDRAQMIARPFRDLAEGIVHNLPRNPERTTALRKLLEARDCALRAQESE